LEPFWRLCPGGDDLWNPQFFVVKADSPIINQLFAALHELILGKLTNMSYVIPCRDRKLMQIFM
jgi:hypothetical protein